MPKRDEFKPGLRNIYLMQAPRDDNGQQTLGIVAYKGAKRDTFANGGVFSISSTTLFAFLEQVHVETQAELLDKCKAHHERWVRPFDLAPAIKAEQPATDAAN